MSGVVTDLLLGTVVLVLVATQLVAIANVNAARREAEQIAALLDLVLRRVDALDTRDREWSDLPDAYDDEDAS